MRRTSVCWAAAVLLGVTTLAQEPEPKFEVASIRPRLTPYAPEIRMTADSLYAGGITVSGLMQLAYSMSPSQLIGDAEWVRREPYEVTAKSAGKTAPEQMRRMVRSLLRDRFKLVARVEQRKMRHQALRLARADGRLGAKMKRCEPTQMPAADSKPMAPPVGAHPIPLGGTCAPLASVAEVLAAKILNTPVVDRTGLQGTWTFRVWFADPLRSSQSHMLPTLANALQQELGLKLDSVDGPIEVLVIDSVSQPTEN